MRRAVVVGAGVAALCLTAAAQAQEISGAAAAPSFVERFEDDPCLAAAAFESDDDSLEARRARRACRLRRFQRRLAVERQQRVWAEEKRQVQRVETWLEATQPVRVARPLSAELFLGNGLSSYGVSGSWAALTSVELGLWLGGRGISMSDFVSSAGTIEYTRWTAGTGARLYFGSGSFSPFVGVGFAMTRASLAVATYNVGDMFGGYNYRTGTGRGHFVTASGGVQFARRSLRIALEYMFGYAFYTQANINDDALTEDVEMRRVWQDSLDKDRHGIRFAVGYAF